LVILLLAVTMASAADVCVGGMNVLAPGFSCEVAGLVFSNFSAISAGSTPVVPEMTLVAVSSTDSTVYLSFNPSIVNTSQGSMDMWFYFQVTGGVMGVDLMNAGDAPTSILERVCSSPIGMGNICNGSELATISAGGGQQAEAMFATTQTAYIFKDIFVGPGGHLSSFTQSFHVPEPMTFVLIGSGLLALGIVRRRAKKV